MPMSFSPLLSPYTIALVSIPYAQTCEVAHTDWGVADKLTSSNRQTSIDTIKCKTPFDQVRGRMASQEYTPPTKKTGTEVNDFAISAMRLPRPISLAHKNDITPAKSSATITPPPTYPSPAHIRAQHSASTNRSMTTAATSVEDPFGESESKPTDAQVARNDSLKKLREATLRRKQALKNLR